MPVILKPCFHAEHTSSVPGVDADRGWHLTVFQHPFDERKAVRAVFEVVVERDRLNRVVVEEVDRGADGRGGCPARGRGTVVVQPKLDG